ncbi:MAG: glycosyltransferase [Coprothermobacterota bacterium]|nr:glycosyltransferase [Coprothermobacterota bacterium]
MITILAAGTRGDTQPYLALGVALKKAGHTVRIATFENYEPFVKSYGLEFFPIKGDVSRVASSDNMRGTMKADNPLKILLSFNKLKSLVFNLQKDFFNACMGSDAIVYHPGAPIGFFAAQDLKIPSILATPFPMTPTRDYPALIFYNAVRLGRTFNFLTHKIFEKVMWSTSSPAIKQFWKKERGHAPEDFACPFSKQNAKNLPTIISCSNYVFPRPNDWSQYVNSTGYWFLDDEVDWRPSSDLLNFIQRGTPPVYVGFGSVVDSTSADQTAKLVMNALRRAGQRGILATGWSGMSKMDNIPEEIFILDSAPHSWLFPQMAAVVHHGGAGTTAAGLRAGVPSIIIPHSNDQFAWGRRVHELGVGSKPIPRKKLTAEKLSDAIKFVLTNEVKAAANDLGGKIQSENGAETAAKIIIDCLEQKGPAFFNQGK